MEDVDTTATNQVTEVNVETAHKTTEIGAEAMVVNPTVILHITVGNMECVPFRVKTAGPQYMATKSMQSGLTRRWSVRETAS